MATKKREQPAEGTARVRFIMLEADVTNGNLTDFANTIANALRSSSHQKTLPIANQSAREAASADVGDVPTVEDTDDSPAAEFDSSATNGAARPARSRKATVTKVKVLDVDLLSPVPFVQYAETKAPDNMTARFLVVAAWFKEHRGFDVVTADHVYTCFKKMAWGATPDMAQPFRDLKKNGRGDYQNGKFSINHIGVGIVEKMGRGTG
jgi:hypothetical protein